MNHPNGESPGEVRSLRAWIVTAAIVAAVVAVIGIALLVANHVINQAPPVEVSSNKPVVRAPVDDDKQLVDWMPIRVGPDFRDVLFQEAPDTSTPGLVILKFVLHPPAPTDSVPSWVAILNPVQTEEPRERAVVHAPARIMHCPAGAGRAAFQEVPEGRYDLGIEMPGWICQNQFNISLGGQSQEVTLDLYKLGRVTCCVRDNGGTPIRDAQVTLWLPDEYMPRHPDGLVDDDMRARDRAAWTRTSDNDGIVLYEELPPSSLYRVSVVSAERPVKRVVGIAVPAGGQASIDVALSEGAFVLGRAASYDGEAITEVSIDVLRLFDRAVDDQFSAKPTFFDRGVAWIQEGETIDFHKGPFRLGPLPPGRVKINIYKSRHRLEFGNQVTLDLAAGQTLDLGELRSKYPPLMLRLIVDEEVECPYFVVYVESRPDPEFANEPVLPGQQYDSVDRSSDFEGFNGMLTLPPGAARITLMGSGGDGEQRFSAEPVILVVEDVGRESKTVEFRVVPRRSTLESCQIPLKYRPTDFRRTEPVTMVVMQPRQASDCFGYDYLSKLNLTQVDGAFRSLPLYLLGPGECTIWATNGESTFVTRHNVQLHSEDGGVDLKWQARAGGLNVKVQTNDGSPLVGAKVEWFWDRERLEKQALPMPFLSETTDARGSALLKGFPTDHGDLCLKVSAHGFKSQVVSAPAGTSIDKPGTVTVHLEKNSR